MHTSLFFRLFPPPAFLMMSHAGLDVFDDAVCFVQYSHHGGSLRISKYGSVPMPSGVIEGGDVKDEKKLVALLADIAKKYGISYAKISIPEEKGYLFEIEVPYGNPETISQNIEFKLEENIPLAAADTVFAFDLLPAESGKPLRASVSAVPRTYIEHMMKIFRDAGIIPLSFETAPRAIARIVSSGDPKPMIVVHSMASKTGVYVVSDRAVGFTSTMSIGASGPDLPRYIDALAVEINRVFAYWLSRREADGTSISKVVIVGPAAEALATGLHDKVSGNAPIAVADVWQAVFDMKRYVPPIAQKDSLEYASAAGLAL